MTAADQPVDQTIMALVAQYPRIRAELKKFRRAPTMADVPFWWRSAVAQKAREFGVAPDALLKRAWELR